MTIKTTFGIIRNTGEFEPMSVLEQNPVIMNTLKVVYDYDENIIHPLDNIQLAIIKIIVNDVDQKAKVDLSLLTLDPFEMENTRAHFTNAVKAVDHIIQVFERGIGDDENIGCITQVINQ